MGGRLYIVARPRVSSTTFSAARHADHNRRVSRSHSAKRVVKVNWSIVTAIGAALWWIYTQFFGTPSTTEPEAAFRGTKTRAASSKNKYAN